MSDPTVPQDVLNERARQVGLGYGPDSDDNYQGSTDWISDIAIYLGSAASTRNGSPQFREGMVKIAALAIAAIESYDRTNGRLGKYTD